MIERDGDPSPAGEGGREAAGWGGRRTPLSPARARSLRKRLTPQEVKLWNWLRESIAPAGFHFRKQVPIDVYVVDFACLPARLVVEVDGGQHGSDEGMRRDAERDARLNALGYRVLRFSNHEVDRSRRIVLDTIRAVLDETYPARRSAALAPPSPTGEGSRTTSSPRANPYPDA